MIRQNPLRSPVLAVLMVWLAGSNLPGAQEENPIGPEAGRKLAAELRAIRPAQEEERQGTLKVVRPGQKTLLVPVVWRTKGGESGWSVTYETRGTETTGAEKLTIIYATNGPNIYLYARALSPKAPLGEAKELKGAEADIPLAGSDFWLSDLGLEFYSWPDQNRAQGEKRSTVACYVLESVNPHPMPGGYSWVKTWIEKEQGNPIAAEAYDGGADKRKLKLFSIGRMVKRPDGSYQPKNIELQNLKTNSRTFLEFVREEK